MHHNSKTWLKPWRVSRTLDCTTDHVYDLVRRGELTAIKLGPRALRISHDSLEGFLAKHRIESTEKD